MSDIKEVLKKISEDAPLADKLKEALTKGIKIEEISALLKEKGIDAPLDKVQDLLAEAKKKFGDGIAIQELDLDELAAVRGGGDGICDGSATCDKVFNSNPEVEKNLRCDFFSYCDEFFINLPGPNDTFSIRS